MTRPFLASVIFALALSATASAATYKDPLAAALAFVANRGNAPYLVREDLRSHSSTPAPETLTGLCHSTPGCPGLPDLTTDLTAAFAAAQSRPASLRGRAATTNGRIASNPDFQEALDERIAGPNVDFSKPILYELSRVGIASDHSQALVLVDETCGSLCGGAFFLVLRRDTSGWSVAQDLIAYIK